jgi:hypothetical protein
LLLGLAAARDQRTVGDADTLAWHADLNTARLGYADAADAISRFYVEQARLQTENRYRITTPDLISIARKIRAERLANYAYVPPGTDDDPQYLDRLRGQIADVASGAVPAPDSPLAITGGPHPDVAARLKAIGRYIPDVVRQELAPYRPAAAAREAAIRAGQADYLSVRCEWCGAPVDEPCRSRRVVPGAGATSNRPRKTPHPSRVEAAEAVLNHRDSA